jgi:SAM-dependent methyltransferase
MLREEARWLGEQLAAIDPTTLFPLCNLGSSTAQFRTVVQPWIDGQVFAPARAAAHAVVHVDLKAADGVDLVGDVGDPELSAELRRRGLRGVLCSNLLEHVDELPAMCRMVWALVPRGGVLVVTVPYRYPRHEDPIDNGFRPTPEELLARFPDGERVVAEIVEDHTYLHYLLATPGRFFGALARGLTPFWRFAQWKVSVRRFGWLHRRFAVSCVVIRKP